MSFSATGLAAVLVITLLGCAAFGSERLKVSSECAQMNSVLADQIDRGRLDDAKQSVLEVLSRDASGLGPVCAGLLSQNVAVAFQRSGRLDEARTFAEHAIVSFQKNVSTDDPVYLGPLQMIAAIDLAQGNTGRAREVFRKMQLIRATDSSDRVFILWISSFLLEREGRNQEAESQLINALSALSDAGKQNSVDDATIRGQLASLYLHENRYREATTTVNSALVIQSRAPGAPRPVARAKLLNTRAVIWCHEGHWKNAESDLGQAVALCRQQPQMDSAELEPILNNYAYVLRRLHRKEAPSVEAWATTVSRANMASHRVIDVTELAAEGVKQR